MHMRLLIIVVAASLATGCTASWEVVPLSVDSAISVPSKYENYNCAQLNGLAKALVAREWQLRALSERASAEASGMVVNAISYWPDLAAVRADRKMLDRTAAANGCKLSSPQLSH